MLDDQALAQIISQEQCLQLAFPGTAGDVRQTLQHLSRSPLFTALEPDIRDSLQIVLAEVLNNIVEHAYAKHCGQIELAFTRSSAGLECRVVDTGLAMPGLALPPGTLAPLGDLEDLPEGGFGWHLIRNLTKGLSYRRAGGRNHLSFHMSTEQ